MISFLNTKTRVKINLKSALTEIFDNQVYNNTIQVAAGFDIEATSFLYNNTSKFASMYIWQMCIGDIIIYGREWYEFSDFIDILNYNLSQNKTKLIIFVHNLSYEFHWIQSHLTVDKVFAREKRKVIYCWCKNIQFRCSYFLTNKSLRVLAKENHLEVLKGFLDYTKIRFSSTPLTDEEIGYALNDVLILREFINLEIKKNKYVQNIPLTQTGYVRRYCLNYIQEHSNWNSYRIKLSKIVPTDKEVFELLHNCYVGGYTHANYTKAGITQEHIHCKDFNSHYPGVMVRKKFPMRMDITKVSLFDYCLKKGKAMAMEIAFDNVKAKTCQTTISYSKCKNIAPDTRKDNGRIISSSHFETYMTDLDYKIFCLYYTFESKRIIKMAAGEYKYLPRPLVMAVLELYKNKTALKGIPEMYSLYMSSKEMVNATYGMSVTNPLNDEIIYIPDTSDWEIQHINDDMISDALTKYYNKATNFLAYQWGVWITAWARYELLTTLINFPEDGIYCDTDSIKYLDPMSQNETFFITKNEEIIKELQEMCRIQDIPWEMVSPKTKKGNEKTIGLWDSEAPYLWFKTLGAKRYCYSYYDEYYESHREDFKYEDSETGEIKYQDNFFTTVSGIRKTVLSNYIMSHFETSPFDMFAPELILSENDSKRISVQYLTKPFSIIIKDYLGNECEVSEQTYVYMENTTFSMSLSDDYALLLNLATTDDTKKV